MLGCPLSALGQMSELPNVSTAKQSRGWDLNTIQSNFFFFFFWQIGHFPLRCNTIQVLYPPFSQ